MKKYFVGLFSAALTGACLSLPSIPVAAGDEPSEADMFKLVAAMQGGNTSGARASDAEKAAVQKMLEEIGEVMGGLGDDFSISDFESVLKKG